MGDVTRRGLAACVRLESGVAPIGGHLFQKIRCGVVNISYSCVHALHHRQRPLRPDYVPAVCNEFHCTDKHHHPPTTGGREESYTRMGAPSRGKPHLAMPLAHIDH
jgi:hypothetical protein